ncbi:MAG: hypothetical protein AAF810_17300 [Cyanobacteria bacterium P01_D01_bin.36]
MGWRADGGGGATALDRARETYPVAGTLKHAGLSGFQINAGTSGLTIAEVEGPDNAADFAGVTLTAGQELVFGQQITMLKLSAGSGVVYNSTQRSAQWYVSSHAGSDSNTGLTATSQFRTIGKLMEFFIAAGDTVIEDDDSYWREQLNIGDSITVQRSGTGTNRPIHDAGDIAANDSFSLSSGQTNTYEIAWTPEAGNGSTDHHLTLYENDELLIYRTSVALVEANPGSYTVNGFANTAGNTVYVHPKSSTNPANDSKEYVIAKRKDCIDGGDDCIIRGIHCIRNVFNDGAIRLLENALIEDCIVEYGTKHNAFASNGTFRRCTFRYNEQYAHSEVTLIVFFRAIQTGSDCNVEECSFIGGNPANTDFPDNTFGYLTHDNSGVTGVNSLTVADSTFDRVINPGDTDAATFVMTGCNATCNAISAGQNISTITNNFFKLPSTYPGGGRLSLNGDKTVTLEGNKFHVEQNSSNLLQFLGGATLVARHNSFNFTGAGVSSVIYSGAVTDTKNITYENNVSALVPSNGDSLSHAG